MAISLQQNSGNVNTGANVNVGTGATRLLIYLGRTAIGSDSITAISVGSLSLTKVGSVQSGGGPNRYITMWAGVPSQTSSQTLTITGAEAGGVVLVYDGVKTSTSPKNFNSTTGNTSGSVSLSITANNGDWLVGECISDVGGVTAGSNTTVREDASSAISVDSNGVASPTALNFSLGSSGKYGIIGCAIEPALSIVCANGSFTLTGQTALLKRIYTIVLAYGSYALSGFALLFSLTRKWVMPDQNTSSWSEQNQNTSTMNLQSKNSSSWTNQNQN